MKPTFLTYLGSVTNFTTTRISQEVEAAIARASPKPSVGYATYTTAAAAVQTDRCDSHSSLVCRCASSQLSFAHLRRVRRSLRASCSRSLTGGRAAICTRHDVAATTGSDAAARRPGARPRCLTRRPGWRAAGRRGAGRRHGNNATGGHCAAGCSRVAPYNVCRRSSEPGYLSSAPRI